MKELSIEGKATRYDQAIKLAKSKIKNDKNRVLYEDDIIEIFPELKESEDEKDNELTLEDVEIILNAFLDLCIENKEQGKTKRYTNEEWCQKVLKRYKERKEK